jgi:hypothetical protein
MPDEPVVIRADEIRARKIVLEAPYNTHRITMEVGGQSDPIAGIWVEQNGYRDAIIAIYVKGDQNCIGLYAKGREKTAINVGIFTTPEGEAMLQVVKKDGSVAHVTGDQLAALAGTTTSPGYSGAVGADDIARNPCDPS